MGRSINRWWSSKGRPPFNAGDYIVPNGVYDYGGNHKWPHDDAREVLFVSLNQSGGFWELGVFNPNMNTVSRYNPANFKQENAEMAAYERVKFTAVRLNEDGHIDPTFVYNAWHDSKHEARVEVAKIIEHGERIVVVQTVMLIEGEEPRPPIRVTEYK